MGVRHHSTIPYSKEENGILERENKEVNSLLNSSDKQPLGKEHRRTPIYSKTSSFNRYGSAIRLTDATLRLLKAATQSQQRTNDDDLRKRYARYQKILLLRQQKFHTKNDRNSDIEINIATEPTSMAHIEVTTTDKSSYYSGNNG